MIKHLQNQRGVALLAVMAVLATLLVVGSIMLKISSNESRTVYAHGNNIRAFYVAEAGADWAIQQWIKYIDSLPEEEIEDEHGQMQTTGYLAERADIDTYITQWLNISKNNLVTNLQGGYGLGGDQLYLEVKYKTEQQGVLDWSKPGDAPIILELTVTGTFEDGWFEHPLKIWYYQNKSTGNHKGTDQPAPPKPPDPPPVSLPENLVLYVNNFIETSKINNANIIGDVVLASKSGETTIIGNDVNFYGDVYISNDLIVEDKAYFHQSVYVKGSVKFNKDFAIKEYLYYEGQYTYDKKPKGTVNHIQRPVVEIPTITLPTLQDEAWYRENGYIVVDQSGIKLEPNKKYYFKIPYQFDNVNVHNVTIVASQDMTFGNKFKGSGFIFAPKNKLTFGNNCTFVGTLISDNIEVGNNFVLYFPQR